MQTNAVLGLSPWTFAIHHFHLLPHLTFGENAKSLTFAKNTDFRHTFAFRHWLKMAKVPTLMLCQHSQNGRQNPRYSGSRGRDASCVNFLLVPSAKPRPTEAGDKSFQNTDKMCRNAEIMTSDFGISAPFWTYFDMILAGISAISLFRHLGHH
jgi:hypothetical protein